MANTFDFETALKQLQSGQSLTGENGSILLRCLQVV